MGDTAAVSGGHGPVGKGKTQVDGRSAPFRPGKNSIFRALSREASGPLTGASHGEFTRPPGPPYQRLPRTACCFSRAATAGEAFVLVFAALMASAFGSPPTDATDPTARRARCRHREGCPRHRLWSGGCGKHGIGFEGWSDQDSDVVQSAPLTM